MFFDGLNFFIMSESLGPTGKSKIALEALVKENGGKIFQTNNAAMQTVCIADRRTVKVASLQKRGEENIIHSNWLFDCIKQDEIDTRGGLPEYLVPLEPRHMFFTKVDQKDEITKNVDEYGDSYARSTTAEELKELLDNMSTNQKKIKPQEVTAVVDRLLDRFQNSGDLEGANPSPGWLFKGMVVYFHKIPTLTRGDSTSSLDAITSEQQVQEEQRFHLASNLIRFGSARVMNKMNTSVTHVIVRSDISSTELLDFRGTLAKRLSKEKRQLAHIVKVDWIEESWRERTLLDEERFYPPP